MNYTFHIQDPTNPKTTYLYEAIVKQVRRPGLILWRGIYAFATGMAVRNLLIEDPIVSHYVKVGRTELIVGLDAVTDQYALRQLTELNTNHTTFSAMVFDNKTRGLFHPKISHFQYKNHDHVLIVGSGNFTPGGLRNNIEAYAVATGTEDEISGLASWDEFTNTYHDSIRHIDEDAIEQAINNSRMNRQAGRRRHEAEPETAVPAEVPETITEYDLPATGQILVAEVPKAGGRWHQVHYNKVVVDSFFRVKADSPQRVFLREVRSDLSLGPEEARPLVYSSTNKNFKIEIAARREIEYPATLKPIIILREIGIRNFIYELLMPGEPGYNALENILSSRPSVGKGVRRSILSAEDLRIAWATCPLLSTVAV